jgi:uncharacterized lipoprotein YajG
MKKHIIWLLPLSAIVFALGCGISLQPTMAVPFIPTAKSEVSAIPKDIEYYIAVEEFSDDRPSKALAVKGEQQSESVTDVGVAVQKAVESSFRNLGFMIDANSALLVRGKVKKWISEVKSGMPSEASSEAVVFVEVLDPTNKRVYHGTYQGTAGIRSPSLSRDQISESLGSAMSQALTQLVSDQGLVTLLRSY